MRSLTLRRISGLTEFRLYPLAAAGLLLAGNCLKAQTTTPAAATPTSKDDDTIVLSPFVIEAAEDKGYQGTSTLAGTRVRTDLRDVASSISVVTSKFLQDTGARNQQDLLVYTTNTEVGGISGNFGGLGGANGVRENQALMHPNQNTRVRGLDSADGTRDYFLSDIPWDSFNVDRVDLQRGPNSILFGVGSPAGIVNTQTIMAQLRKSSGKVENRIDQFGSLRNSIDGNYVLARDVLALRVAALDDQTKYRQEPAYNHDRRAFASLRFDPKWLSESAHTSLRVNAEIGSVNANRPRELAPMDQITPFFASKSLNPKDASEPALGKATYDPWVAWVTVINGSGTNTPPVPAGGPTVWNPWVAGYMARLGSADPVFWYENNSGAPFRVMQSNPATGWAIGAKGNIDRGIDGIVFGRPVGINGYNGYTIAAERRAQQLGLADPFPGAQKNYYKDKSLTDPSVFDFYNKLIDGPNKMEKEGWTAFNANASQTFLDNRIAFEAVWDKQHYHSRQETNLSDSPAISVDINANLMYYPNVYTGLQPELNRANPNVGRAYVGNSGHYGNSENVSDRSSQRYTAFGELRSTDFFDKGWLTSLLGRHDFNVVFSRDDHKQEQRDYLRYGSDANWATSQNDTTNITQGFRQVDWISYLSPDLRTRTSASGADIQNITAVQSPAGQTMVQYFNSHWKPSTNPSDPTYIDPAAVWTSAWYGTPSTQSENPANYVGWTSMPVGILNADKGDRDQLYTAGSKVRNTLSSLGLTWQGYLWDDTIVPVLGYRKDKVKSYSATAPTNPVTGVATTDYPYSASTDALHFDASDGISHSFGVVVHTPKAIRNRLPWGSDISLTYGQSSNFRAENRVDFMGNRVPNARGKTKEFGVIVSTLEGRYSLKATVYKTTVSDANLSGDPASSTLGANTYWLWAAQAWGTASAVADEMGLAGKAPGSPWYWDWANHDVNTAYGANPRDPAGAAIDANEKKAADNWIATMLPQSFYDAYGLPVHVDAIKAAATANAWGTSTASNFIGGGWSPDSGPGGVQPAGAGRVRGMYPVGTIDNESKGVEFEFNAKPLPNWDVTLNVSKTTASRTNLSKSLSDFIEATHTRLQGPAGDLRTWWAGDTSGTFRSNFNGTVYSAYQFQLEQNGQSAPEVHPWAFNTVTNYAFTRGAIKGLNVGGGWRWQDKAILGYGLIKAPTALDPNNVKLDVNQPIRGTVQSHVDFWVGYERKLTDKIKWRIQANVRNVGEKVHLVAISVEPDGTAAAQRIQEGTTWTLTNTLFF